MTSRRDSIKDDTHFWVLKLMQDNPGMTQRALAKELGMSLGGANYCLQALVEKGWLKMQNFSQSKNKLGYAYLLTPVGIAEKTALTGRFLKRKMQEYEDLKAEIEALQRDVALAAPAKSAAKANEHRQVV
jgi:EPS-associated MarR family transcriptional regulator